MPPAPSCSSHRHHRACGRAIIWPKKATYASLAEEHNILQTEELSQCTPSVPNPGIQMVPEKWSESHSHLFVVVLIPALAALARGQTWRDFCFSRERKN